MSQLPNSSLPTVAREQGISLKGILASPTSQRFSCPRRQVHLVIPISESPLSSHSKKAPIRSTPCFDCSVVNICIQVAPVCCCTHSTCCISRSLFRFGCCGICVFFILRTPRGICIASVPTPPYLSLILSTLADSSYVPDSTTQRVLFIIQYGKAWYRYRFSL